MQWLTSSGNIFSVFPKQNLIQTEITIFGKCKTSWKLWRHFFRPGNSLIFSSFILVCFLFTCSNYLPGSWGFCDNNLLFISIRYILSPWLIVLKSFLSFLYVKWFYFILFLIVFNLLVLLSLPCFVNKLSSYMHLLFYYKHNYTYIY